MSSSQPWPTVESEVDRPASWFAGSVGLLFLIIGIVGFFSAGALAADGVPDWIIKIGASAFAIFGSVPLVVVIKEKLSPASVIHAAPEVLPNVPDEPVILEGSIVYGRMTHELHADDRGWQLRPCLSWQKSKRAFLGFAIPFMLLFAAVLSWIFHNQMKVANWPASIAAGALITLLVGGTTFALIGMAIKAGYSRLCTLAIPNDGEDLELDSPESPNRQESDITAGLRWIFLGSEQRHRLTIPPRYQ